MTTSEPTVVLTRKGIERLRAGHPWIYKSDVARADARGGDVVRLVDGRGWFAGRAFYSDRSQIAVRLVTREDVPVDAGLLAARLEAAWKLRRALMPDTDAWRVVHADADGIPGLVVDRFGPVAVIQTLVQATDALREKIARICAGVLGVSTVVERNDVRVREHEGLPLRKSVLLGPPPGTVEYDDGDGVRLVADPLEGQKTGAFLDQRENRMVAGRLARGRALDCFTYGGAFALHLAARAERVVAVEIQETAAALARAAVERAGATNVEVVVANAFDFLRAQADAGERYATIVLDPPAFAKSKGSLQAGLRGYKEINLRALSMLEPGGVLVTCSCSYHVDDVAFEGVVAEAAADAGRAVQVIERRGAARDHPSLLGVPQTRYLKCLVLRALS